MDWKRTLYDRRVSKKRYVFVVAIILTATVLATEISLPDMPWSFAEEALGLAIPLFIAGVAGYRGDGLLVGVGGAVAYFLVVLPDYILYIGNMTFADWLLGLIIGSLGLGIVTGVVGYGGGVLLDRSGITLPGKKSLKV